MMQFKSGSSGKTGDTYQPHSPKDRTRPGECPDSGHRRRRLRRQKVWRVRIVSAIGAIGVLVVSGTWIMSMSHAVAPKTLLSSKVQIKGVVSDYSLNGWPMIDNTPVHLSGIGLVAPASHDQFVRWITSHGGYLECDSSNGGDTYRCLTAQRIDVAQAILLNGAAQATGDADPLYRAAEETGKRIQVRMK